MILGKCRPTGGLQPNENAACVPQRFCQFGKHGPLTSPARLALLAVPFVEMAMAACQLLRPGDLDFTPWSAARRWPGRHVTSRFRALHQPTKRGRIPLQPEQIEPYPLKVGDIEVATSCHGPPCEIARPARPNDAANKVRI